MFPERPKPEYVESTKSNSSDDNDFLSKHGGKVALAGFGLAIAIFYRWWKGGTNRTDLIEKLVQTATIEPFEIQELRLGNNITTEDYNEISGMIITEGRKTLSYREFCSLVSTTTGGVGNSDRRALESQDKQSPSRPPIRINQGHLLDRLVIAYTANRPLDETDGGRRPSFSSGSFSSSAGSHFADVQLPVDYLMVLLNLVVRSDFLSRIDSLFNVAYLCENSGNGMNDNSIGAVQELNNVVQPSSSDSPDHSIVLKEDDRVETVSLDSVIRITELLIATNQIPSEKQAKETGVEYPFVTYRVKSAAEMASLFFETNKITVKPSRFNKDDFRAIMLSKQICVWGECYR
jgi:hypothetical protein